MLTDLVAEREPGAPSTETASTTSTMRRGDARPAPRPLRRRERVDRADAGTKVSAAGWHRLFLLIALFLVAFGLLNFAELPLGWKDRVPQISRYLEATVGVGPEWVMPVLWINKSIEGALGVLALIGLWRRDARYLAGSILGWMGMFTGFIVMDIWAADRAELQEHTVYFMAFAQILVVIIAVQAVGSIRAALRSRHHS